MLAIPKFKSRKTNIFFYIIAIVMMVFSSVSDNACPNQKPQLSQESNSGNYIIDIYPQGPLLAPFCWCFTLRCTGCLSRDTSDHVYLNILGWEVINKIYKQFLNIAPNTSS